MDVYFIFCIKFLKFFLRGKYLKSKFFCQSGKWQRGLNLNLVFQNILLKVKMKNICLTVWQKKITMENQAKQKLENQIEYQI